MILLRDQAAMLAIVEGTHDTHLGQHLRWLRSHPLPPVTVCPDCGDDLNDDDQCFRCATARDYFD